MSVMCARFLVQGFYLSSAGGRKGQYGKKACVYRLAQAIHCSSGRPLEDPLVRKHMPHAWRSTRAPWWISCTIGASFILSGGQGQGDRYLEDKGTGGFTYNEAEETIFGMPALSTGLDMGRSFSGQTTAKESGPDLKKKKAVRWAGWNFARQGALAKEVIPNSSD